MKSYFKKGWAVFLLFTLIVSVSQYIILKPHLGFGFSPDDVRLISDFISLGSNPFSKFSYVWNHLGGPHIINPLYYNGILFSFFGFNYSSYHLTALIFKILSIACFYLLIQTVFKNRLLSFLSGVIYSFHYGSVGSMEMVARTQDYLVITGLNIFLILFYLISVKRLKNILLLVLSSFVLFSAFFINPIRAYPILPFICFLGILQFSSDKSLPNFYRIVKNLAIIFLPFILFFGLFGSGGSFHYNSYDIIKRVSNGNLQMLLSPFSSFGSLFITEGALRLLSLPRWNPTSFLDYFFTGPFILFGVVTIALSKIFSSKPLKFFFRVFIANFIAEMLIFLAINHGINLPENLRQSYDPVAYAPAAILGVYIIVVSLFVFLEWFKNKQNIYLKLYLFGICSAVTFVWFTWILYDFSSIPMGIYGYSTIPVMGISTAIASILVLAYTRISVRFNKHIAPLVFLILIPYFIFSNNLIQTYLEKNLTSGNNWADQIRLKDKFWQLVENPHSCNKLFYLSVNDYPNGYFYSFIMLDRFDRWYSLYSPYHSKQRCPVALVINNEENLLINYKIINGKKGFLYKDIEYLLYKFEDADFKEGFIPIEDLQSLKLQDRDITNINEEILQKLPVN